MKDKCVLQDCGFLGKRSEEYAKAVDEEDYRAQLRLLTEQRAEMLEEMHAAAKKLDCIDYLICRCKEKLQ